MSVSILSSVSEEAASPALHEELPESLTLNDHDDVDDGNDEMEWQGWKTDLSDSIYHLLKIKLLCDIEFIVGSGPETEAICAHKLILSARSQVFLAMFSKNWSADSNEIKVSDIEPSAFKDMLRFVYTDDLELSLDTVTAVIYAARKYSIVALEDHCTDFLYENLCPENVCSVLIQAQLYSMTKLVNDCLEVIAENPSIAINADDFFNIDVETLCLVLKRSDLRIDEISLFDAVNRWAENNCVKNNCHVSPEKKRFFLKNALFLLRFPLMEPEDFSSKVVASGLLTEAEMITVFKHFNTKSQPEDTIFNSTPRRAFSVVKRFQHEVNGGCFGSFYSTDYHKITLHTNHKIKLVGVGLYGTPDVRYNVEGSMINLLNETTKPLFQRSCYCSDKIFRIFFREPYEMDASESQTYTLQVKFGEPYSTYGCGGIISEKIVTMIDKEEKVVTITFSNSESVDNESNRGHKTDVSSGQIPELLFEA